MFGPAKHSKAHLGKRIQIIIDRVAFCPKTVFNFTFLKVRFDSRSCHFRMEDGEHHTAPQPQDCPGFSDEDSEACKMFRDEGTNHSIK